MKFKVKDHYYNKAKKENFLARSIYKLEEIDKKFKILKANDLVLDLGYYPGSWIQYTSKMIHPGGEVVGIDIQAVNKKLSDLKNVTLIQDDILEMDESIFENMNKKFDVILSDMAPSTTGVKSVDQARSLELVEMVFQVASKFLIKQGCLVVKVFDSNDAQVFLKECKNLFDETYKLKPKSTRSVSKEFFFIGKNFKGSEVR